MAMASLGGGGVSGNLFSPPPPPSTGMGLSPALQAIANKLKLANNTAPVANTFSGGNPYANPFASGNNQPSLQDYNTAQPQDLNGLVTTLQGAFDGGTGKFTPADQLYNNNPYSDLQQQLMNQLQGINVAPTPYEQLKAQADAQAAAQFDPQITALQGEISSSKKRGGQSKKDARSMYDALSKDALSQLPQLTQQMKSAQDETSARYNDAKAQLQQQYAQQSQDQQNILKNLGIQAAAGDGSLNAQSLADKAYFQQQQAQDSRQQQDALAQMGMTDQNFTRDIANTDRLAGENTAQDIQRQLEQYLQSSGDKLSGLQGSKSSTAAALLGQLQQADQQRVGQLQNQQFNQTMAMNDYSLKLLEAQNSQQNADNNLQLQLQKLAAQQQGQGTYSSGMNGAANFLGKQYPNNPQLAGQLSTDLAQILGSPDVVSGRQTIQDPMGVSTQVNTTNEYVMNKLRELAQQQHLGNADINNLIDAYLAYKGQLR